MTTARHAAPTPDKQRRDAKRRRVGREELLAVAVLLLVLAVTLVLIGLQWLDVGPAATAAGPFTYRILEVAT